MGYSGCRPKHNRGVELLGNGKGDFDEVLCLLTIAWLDHRNLCELRVVPIILFILRAVKLRIVGGDQDQSSPDPGVRECEEGIGSHINPDVFHRNEGPPSRVARPYPHLKCNLLVGRPLAVDAFVVLYLFENFGGRGARICGGKYDSGLKRAPGNRFVPRKEFSFHYFSPVSPIFSLMSGARDESGKCVRYSLA